MSELVAALSPSRTLMLVLLVCAVAAHDNGVETYERGCRHLSCADGHMDGRDDCLSCELTLAPGHPPGGPSADGGHAGVRSWLADLRARRHGSATGQRGAEDVPSVESAQLSCQLECSADSSLCDGLWQLTSPVQSDHPGSGSDDGSILQTAWAVGHPDADTDLVSLYTLAFAPAQPLSDRVFEWLRWEMDRAEGSGTASGGANDSYHLRLYLRPVHASAVHAIPAGGGKSVCKMWFVARDRRLRQPWSAGTATNRQKASTIGWPGTHTGQDGLGTWSIDGDRLQPAAREPWGSTFGGNVLWKIVVGGILVNPSMLGIKHATGAGGTWFVMNVGAGVEESSWPGLVQTNADATRSGLYLTDVAATCTLRFRGGTNASDTARTGRWAEEPVELRVVRCHEHRQQWKGHVEPCVIAELIAIAAFDKAAAERGTATGTSVEVSFAHGRASPGLLSVVEDLFRGATSPRFLVLHAPHSIAPHLLELKCSFTGVMSVAASPANLNGNGDVVHSSVGKADAPASAGAGASADCSPHRLPVRNSQFSSFLPGNGLAGSIPSLMITRFCPQGGDCSRAPVSKSIAIRLRQSLREGLEAAQGDQDKIQPLQPLEWVHLSPCRVSRAISHMRVANWVQTGGTAEDSGVICFAHDIGIRPELFNCLDHHLLFFNSPAANVSQTLAAKVHVPSTLTFKVLVDCCGAGWEGHSCAHHGGFRVALAGASSGAVLAHTWYAGVGSGGSASRMYGENPCEALERHEGIMARCSAFVLPWSHGAGGWDDEPMPGSESGWGGAGKGQGGENGEGGQGDQVCGPFLVVLSVDLWKAAPDGAVKEQGRHAQRGSGPAESERAASFLEGEPLRLVLGSNRCVGRC